MMLFFWNDAARKPEDMDSPPEDVNNVEYKFYAFRNKMLTTIAKISTGFVVETIIFAKVC